MPVKEMGNVAKNVVEFLSDLSYWKEEGALLQIIKPPAFLAFRLHYYYN